MRLIMITIDFWVLEKTKGDMTAGPRKRILTLMRRMGFSSFEIELGISSMLKQGHNVAHFGVLAKSFMFSVSDSEVEDQVPVAGAA
jgi:hypothetical protein